MILTNAGSRRSLISPARAGRMSCSCSLSCMDRTIRVMRRRRRSTALGLGATLVGDRRDGPDKGWTVLADPKGNEFCVLTRYAPPAETPLPPQTEPLARRGKRQERPEHLASRKTRPVRLLGRDAAKTPRHRGETWPDGVTLSKSCKTRWAWRRHHSRRPCGEVAEFSLTCLTQE